ncbi:hypothetical protein [Caulobacter soli]|uniref:hypothetical protein n=1 Tax=Caulobacter soli TaxID=2708539 RepID=UPI0013EAFE75|nr:hypothetical protein [Caulobacter soli]
MAKPIDVGVNTRVGPRTIEASRLKLWLYLAISLVFVAIGVMMVQDPSAGLKGWLVLLFFGLGVAAFVVLLVRPQVLDLDTQGFTLRGGFVRSPKTVLWRDVERFFVYRLPRGGKMIGYMLEPAARKDTALNRIARSFGADGALPKGWPGSPEKMVEDLNAYRLWALGGR